MEKTMTKEEILKTQEEIDKEIISVCGNEAGLDGIADVETFLKCGKYKILWILKEAGKPDNFDDKAYNYRERFRYAADYSKWKLTWGKIALVSYGINKSCEEGKVLPLSEIPKMSLDCNAPLITGTNIYPLDEIAIINVKKTFTEQKTSNQGEIIAEYNKPEIKDLLMRQVKYINPEIVIIANRVQKLAEDLAGMPLADFTDVDGMARYALSKERRLVIYAYHPASRFSKKAYYDSILTAVKNTIL